MPGVSIVAGIAPVTVIIEVVDARDVIVHIVVARLKTRGIVIVRIVKIRIVILVTAVIIFRIASAVVVIDLVSGLAGLDPRDRRLRPTLTGHRQIFALLNAAGATLADNLRLSVEHRGHGISVFVYCNLIKPGLLEINGSARRRNFKQITRRD